MPHQAAAATPDNYVDSETLRIIIAFLIIDNILFLSIMGNTMPARPPPTSPVAAAKLKVLGERIRARRKALGINATVTAEAAGMSRVTLYRIEKGEPAVTIGAYLNALVALDLDFGILTPDRLADAVGDDAKPGWIPVRVRLGDYPQLKRLAWQIHGTDELTPREALGIYERNRRHLDLAALEPSERELIDALRRALGETHSLV
ncbi:MAG TPA: helix-turn-helix domain-containing protein [Lamprocystis sp. (in: g-proteobacteria)]|nr:helix-turn-helix domain-containing protein [Lamprocystis sp. (in: g-proteobacteria)]